MNASLVYTKSGTVSVSTEPIAIGKKKGLSDKTELKARARKKMGNRLAK